MYVKVDNLIEIYVNRLIQTMWIYPQGKYNKLIVQKSKSACNSCKLQVDNLIEIYVNRLWNQITNYVRVNFTFSP